MSEEMNKEAEVQEDAVDIPVTDGSEEEAADTAQTAEEETSEEPAQTEETEQSDQEAESQNEQQVEELTDRLKRSMAEFDNYRKRTEKEKSSMYIIGARDIVEKMLPIVDNFERGLAQAPEDDSFAEGMKMIYRQMMTAFDEMGVKPIEAVGKEFDPNLHNAVMHVEDESVGENIVVEEFQKGYTYKDFVVRHSMVKVAN